MLSLDSLPGICLIVDIQWRYWPDILTTSLVCYEYRRTLWRSQPPSGGMSLVIPPASLLGVGHQQIVSKMSIVRQKMLGPPVTALGFHAIAPGSVSVVLLATPCLLLLS